MTRITDELASNIPQLRRYARGLTGTQRSGDAYVKLCLETYLAEPDRLVADEDVRIQLYSLFHDVWSVVALTLPDIDEGSDPEDDPLVDGLQTLPMLKRQILLLTRLEGFSIAQTGRILGIDAEDVRRGRDEASRLLRRRLVDTQVALDARRAEEAEEEALPGFALRNGHASRNGYRAAGSAMRFF